MDSTPRPLTTFHLFPRLPTELRLHIWTLTLRPRTVDIRYYTDGFHAPDADNTLPIALKVCRESRGYLLDSYPYCFGSRIHPPRLRFNFSLDTLYFDRSFEHYISHFFGILSDTEIQNLRYLAIDCVIPSLDNDHASHFMSIFQKAHEALTNLKELALVYDVEDLANLDTKIFSPRWDNPMELFHDLPEELKVEGLNLDALPDAPENQDVGRFAKWEYPKFVPIYGWRRCPITDRPNYQYSDTSSHRYRVASAVHKLKERIGGLRDRYGVRVRWVPMTWRRRSRGGDW
ncbi:hypothetical protein B7494_g3579 [Chlorociboria aeruginascens]|nr:hypothetical protein B7494_g3579 [Chlorociboria aeruginascens]